MTSSILWIDDSPDTLHALTESLEAHIDAGVAVRRWQPVRAGAPAFEVFERSVDVDTVLVVTDRNLTDEGPPGLFGSTIVEWCRRRGIPVASYSRKPDELPREPDLFDIRIPDTTTEEAGPFIAEIARGFSRILTTLTAHGAPPLGGPASALAYVVNERDLENSFAQYATKAGPASGSLMARVTKGETPNLAEKNRMVAYLVGHILLNSVLRFPGPIISAHALRAYLATDDADSAPILALLAAAKYHGPFARIDQYFWTHRVDAILEPAIPADVSVDTAGELNRRAVEALIGHAVARHACPHCDGMNGGFFCPFTDRTVCDREDCSVGPNSWIPQGAHLCRIERAFFDEWAPLLAF